jgi:hypothetical protein
MLTRYLIMALVAVALLGGTYWQGRRDGTASVKAANLEAYEKALVSEQTARDSRVKAEHEARVANERYVRSVRSNLDQVKEDFSGIPQVVLNDAGCADLSDAFRLQWNANEHAVVEERSGAGIADDSVRKTEL